MFCESCGSFIPDNQSFCSNCGAAAPQPVAQPASQPNTTTATQPGYTQPEAVPVQPVYQEPPYQQPAAQPVYAQPVMAAAMPAAPVKAKNGPATAGLVFGILTIVFSWIPFFNLFTTSILGLLGLIFSIIGLAKKNAGGKPKAAVGLVLTILGTVVTVFIYIFAYQAVVNEIENDPELSRQWEEVMEAFETIDTGYSENDSTEYFIDGDFVSTDKGYVSGVLHIDGFRVDF